MLPVANKSRVELPRPAWQGLPLQQRGEHPGIRAERPQHDYWSAHCQGYRVPSVQRGGRMDVRQGIREYGEVQGGKVYPRVGPPVQCYLIKASSAIGLEQIAVTRALTNYELE